MTNHKKPDHSGTVLRVEPPETWKAKCECKWSEEHPTLAAASRAMADHLLEEGCEERASIFQHFAEPE